MQANNANSTFHPLIGWIFKKVFFRFAVNSLPTNTNVFYSKKNPHGNSHTGKVDIEVMQDLSITVHINSMKGEKSLKNEKILTYWPL